jgi:metallophosphoesterase (TIGR00282 family)
MQHHLAQKKPESIRVLCLGDIVGRPGRKLLRERLPALRASLGADMVIANGENAAGGIGLSPDTLRELLAAGVDVVTSGNHIWKHRKIYPVLDKSERLLRPLNYGDAAPGRGCLSFALSCGTRVGVLNLIGRVFMDPADCPFAAADTALAQLREQGAAMIFVDFHAEASSEKRAMAHYLDGRCTAVLGTHTHVQTADAFVSPAGTASLTDLGLCGVERESVLGMDTAKVLKRFTTGLPHPFIPARGDAVFNGALVEVHKMSGRALSICLVRGNAVIMLH